jgi:hypothetical protein
MPERPVRFLSAFSSFSGGLLRRTFSLSRSFATAARHRRCFALRHQHFNPAHKHHDLPALRLLFGVTEIFSKLVCL